jgi:transcription elongation factor Elf1
MPYLEYLFCEHCGDYARLEIDPGATIEAYNGEGRKSSFINQATIVWDYLIYTCGICGRSYKYTYRDVERRVREYFSSFSDEFQEYLDKTIDAVGEGEGQEEPPELTRIVFKRDSLAGQRVRNLYTAKK